MLFGADADHLREAPEDGLVGSQRVGTLAPERLAHAVRQDAVRVGDRRDDPGNEIVLEREDLVRVERPVVGLGPEVRAGNRVDQLDRDPQRRAGLTQTPVQDVARAERLADGADVRRLARVARGRAAGDDPKVREPGESGDDRLGHPFRHRFEARVRAVMLEGKHGDPEALVGAGPPGGGRPNVRRGRRPGERGRRARRGLGLQLPQLVVDVAGGLVAIARVLLEAAADDPRQVRGNVRPQVRDGGGVSRRIEDIMSTALAPWNGRSPVTIW